MQKHNTRLKAGICIALVLLFVLSILPMSASAVQLKESIKRGDHIKWGTSSGKSIVWIATTDSAANGDVYVPVITKNIVKLRSYHNKDLIPESFNSSSLYSWLNSDSGFWSEKNFSAKDRELRTDEGFTIPSYDEMADMFSSADLAQYAVAEYDGQPTEWWLANYDSDAAETNTIYIINSAGQPDLQYIENVPETVFGVRPVTTLDLTSFYIASGNGSSSKPYVIRPINNSELQTFSVNGCVLTPSINLTTYNYTASVVDTVEQIELNAVSSDSNTELVVLNNNNQITSTGDGLFTIPLDYGENVITVRNTAVDNTTESLYTITVTREEPENTLFVRSLRIYENDPRDELLVSPSFLETTYNYSIDVGKDINRGYIEYVGAPNSSVSISLNSGAETPLGAPNVGGVISGEFDIPSDLRLITVSVTSENQKETRKYVINVEHGDFAAYVNPHETEPDTNLTDPTDPEPEKEKTSALTVFLIILIILVIIAIIVGAIIGIIFFVRRKKEMPTDADVDEMLRRDNSYIQNYGAENGYLPANSQYNSNRPARPANNMNAGGYNNQPNDYNNQPNGYNSQPNRAANSYNNTSNRAANGYGNQPAQNRAYPSASQSIYAPGGSTNRSGYSANTSSNPPMNSADMDKTRVIGSMYAPNPNDSYDMERTRVLPQTDPQQNYMMPPMSSSAMIINEDAEDISTLGTDNMNTPVQPQTPANMKREETAPKPAQQEKPKFVLNFDADSEINMAALDKPSSDDLINNMIESDNILSGKPSFEDVFNTVDNNPVEMLDEQMGYDPELDIFSSSALDEDITMGNQMNTSMPQMPDDENYDPNYDSSDNFWNI